MAPTRRLRGMAALSAGALATVGLSSAVVAADECTDEACEGPALGMTELIKAFGGAGMSDEELEQMEAFYKVVIDPSFQGNEFSPESISQLLEMYQQMGIDIPPEAFADMEELFMKFDTGPAGVAAIDEPADTEDAIFKFIDESSPELIDVDDVLPLIEEALLKRGDGGQTDTATVKAILEMLAQEE